jgi:hypothetical protein
MVAELPRMVAGARMEGSHSSGRKPSFKYKNWPLLSVSEKRVFKGLWLCGCAAVRLCGCAAVRLCGCAAVRLCGCAAVRLCGCAAVRLCGCAAHQNQARVPIRHIPNEATISSVQPGYIKIGFKHLHGHECSRSFQHFVVDS